MCPEASNTRNHLPLSLKSIPAIASGQISCVPSAIKGVLPLFVTTMVQALEVGGYSTLSLEARRSVRYCSTAVL